MMSRDLSSVLKTLTFSALIFTLGCGDGSDEGDKIASDCQVTSVSGSKHTILHGTKCKASSSPIAHIRFGSSSCSGVLISREAVLTAGHCFSGLETAAHVEVGGEAFEAASITLHPGYVPRADQIDNDVAVIRLRGSSGTEPLRLGVSQAVPVGATVRILGYMDDTLTAGRMVIIETTPTHLVTVYDGNGAVPCFGDSGGAVIADRTGESELVGIISTSLGEGDACEAGDVNKFIAIRDKNILDFILHEVPGAKIS